MLRTQISLTEQERAALDAAAARTGRSVAALIRDAVDAMFMQHTSAEEDSASMDRAFGAWGNRDEDGATYVARLRSGRRVSRTQ